jgi:hypothetical protein
MPCVKCAGPGIRIFVGMSYASEMQFVNCAGVCSFAVHPCLAADVVVFIGLTDRIVNSSRIIYADDFALQTRSETVIECFASGRWNT